ncbi:hypothetical protein Bca52824_006749 [Brassica carinata]|uniref:Glycine-rich protein n=1 Tax=Brassica carinata TaxID=52824 RepID=A0A8X7W5P3_BRACI|nr:hypothetical protein Bca52824_006749 [Brassica carinata]
MSLSRTTLVLYILLIFQLEHNLSSVNSRPSSADAYYESLPLRATKPDVVGIEGKGQELAVVIEKGDGGRWRGGGGGTGIEGGGRLHGMLGLRGWLGGVGRRVRGWFGSRTGGGGGWRRGGGNGIGGGGGLPGGSGGSTGKGGFGPLKQIPMQIGGSGTGGSQRSSSSGSIRGGVCTVCWLSLLVLAGLLLV